MFIIRTFNIKCYSSSKILRYVPCCSTVCVCCGCCALLYNTVLWHRHTQNSTEQHTNTATCAVPHIHRATNCMIEWTLACNYRLWQYVCCSQFLRPPHPICPQSHWPFGFYVMTTETVHSVLLTQPYTAWTLWHVSTGDHSSNSNDCCCGSLSQLMTSAMGWGKGLSCCWCRSVHLSVSKTLEVTAQSGGPTDNNSACSYECFHSFVHPYMKKIRHTPPQSWTLFPLKWHGCWPTPPHSLQQSHILRGWITAPGLCDLPGDRWRGYMQMGWRDAQLCKASVKGSMFCAYVFLFYGLYSDMEDLYICCKENMLDI